MRTTKRFSPRLLDLFRERGRGTGTYGSYIPWHRVSRSDPASRGRSHLIAWRGRHVELLSDGEFTAFCFSTRLITAKNDLREQFPLSQERSPHELTAYDARFHMRKYPGTLEIAKNLGIKHPLVHGGGLTVSWVMTTDLLLMLRTDDGTCTLLAIAVKDRSLLSKRALALLTIEEAYWNCRGVPWLLITPSLYHPQVAETLHRTWQWALQIPVSEQHLLAAETAIHCWQGNSLFYLLHKLSQEFKSLSQAQHAVWQVIWSGRTPIDFHRSWRPHIPLQLLSQAQFDQLNPILMRRSAWT